MARITVVGSINMDLVVRAEHFPAPGETVRGDDVHFFPGGKGANQAVAAARTGGEVSFVGQVGSDRFGPHLRSVLEEEAINTDAVLQCDGASGVALITLDRKGENHIVISPGANGRVDTRQINRSASAFSHADCTVFQLELPVETVWHAIKKARTASACILLNPAPARTIPDAIYPLLDVLVVNESEAALLTGNAPDPLKSLSSKTDGLVVLTLGSRGLEAITGKKERITLSAHRVTPTDTTAAGDAFVGALSVLLAEGKPVREALAFANAAAALSTTRLGAQPSLARREEVAAFMQGNAQG